MQYAPRQLGLTEPRIYISDLLAHTQYTFEIQAVNGVTDQSPFSPQFASVNITTNQAGEPRGYRGRRLSLHAVSCPARLRR